MCGGDAAFLSDNFHHLLLLLWSPYVIGQTIIFSSCFFFLSSFFFFFLLRIVLGIVPYAADVQRRVPGIENSARKERKGKKRKSIYIAPF